ncbi:ABC-2 transporter permease [Caldifermentibacillus hisashii]|uniref:ABC-2 transporter permease n=1 Tax=Caldifermentibacillus hisashii TaxID=996558 RepID=UPI000BA323C0|nr:ABC-2 transporter permease [Caldifermentibacillus hisashii]PAC35263.1 hypothetical protein CEJ87_10370 [Caldifermentibacillus hisashii]
MFHLIKKDLLVQKKSVLLSIVFILFFSLFFSKIGAPGLLIGVLGVTYLLALGSSAIDDKNNSDKMLISLPIKRNTIVLAKYLSVIVFAAFAILINLLIYLVVDILKLPLQPIPFSLTGMAGSIIVSVLYCSISFPVIFKYGFLKSRMINSLLFFLLIFGGSALISYMTENNPRFLFILSSLSNIEAIFVILLPTIFIFVLSYLLSLSFYKNREF